MLSSESMNVIMNSCRNDTSFQVSIVLVDSGKAWHLAKTVIQPELTG